MRKFPLYCTVALLMLLITGSIGCKKSNGIDNSQVIETPYSLYFSDTAGALYVTNDGTNSKLVVTPDGLACLAVCTTGPNILWSKVNPKYTTGSVYLSTDDGRDFNHTYDSLASYPDLACNNLAINMNQSSLFNIPAWNRVYTMSNATPGDSHNVNYLGLVHNDTFGIRGHWSLDIFYDTFRVGKMPVRMYSLTQLANGVLCGLAWDPDGYHVRNFYKPCADDGTCRWKEDTYNADGVPSLPTYITSGAELPPYSAYPTPSYFTLGHFNNRLLAIDSKCTYGAWYSDDTGKTWMPCLGLPTNVPLLCIASPFEHICLVGTDSSGLYTYNANTNTFVQNANGLSKNLIIRSIAFKENLFKNGNLQQYVYLATNQGIFQSVDGGNKWTKTINGNFVAVY